MQASAPLRCTSGWASSLRSSYLRHSECPKWVRSRGSADCLEWVLGRHSPAGRD
jgi:hypothetical protein